jgi:hypothetical protein
MNVEDKRAQRLQLLDDHIARSMRDIEARGELAAAPSWGKPLDFGDGYEETPPELRMAFKTLKDAGIVPREVEMMCELAELKLELAAAAGNAKHERGLRHRIAAMQQAIALRLETLRSSGKL